MLAVCVLVHLLTIIYATQSGLSASEILARTRGNAVWLTFYAVFVVSVAVHGPIGLRTVLSEMTGWRGRSLDVCMLIAGLLLAILGFRAAWAVFA